MNPERQLELFRQAQEALNQGFALFREALAVGPVRLNREESIDLWRATTGLVDDIVPALEAFIRCNLQDMMEEGEESLTRKQIWRLYFLHKEGATSAEQREIEEANRAGWEERWRQEREEDALWDRQQRQIRAEYNRRVEPLYRRFGIYLPGRPCVGTTKAGSQCGNYANRLSDQPLCSQHQPDKSYKQKQAEWEALFYITPIEFDSAFKDCIVPFVSKAILPHITNNQEGEN